MIDEKYNNIKNILRYREPYNYTSFDSFLKDINIEKYDMYLTELEIVNLFQAWLVYKDRKDFKEKPLKYLKILDR